MASETINYGLHRYLAFEYMRDGTLEQLFGVFSSLFTLSSGRMRWNAGLGRCYSDRLYSSRTTHAVDFYYNTYYAVAIMLQAAKAIDYVHSQKVSHVFPWL